MSDIVIEAAPIREIDEEEMRKLFNDGRYFERARAGEFRVVIVADTRASRRSGQPHGTRSQEIHYCDKYGRTVAILHQYRRPDGTLGGSGRPDPKFLIIEGMIYRLRRGEDWDHTLP
jgi:hypothetical protein